MANGYRTKNRNKLPPFVPLTWEMLNSKAYIGLKYSTAKALPYFLGKVKVPYSDPQKHLIEFSFSYAEALKYRFAIGTHHRVISELMEKGFIDPVSKGGLRGGGLSSSLFRLSERWKTYGTPNFKKAKPWEQFHQGV